MWETMQTHEHDEHPWKKLQWGLCVRGVEADQHVKSQLPFPGLLPPHHASQIAASPDYRLPDCCLQPSMLRRVTRVVVGQPSMFATHHTCWFSRIFDGKTSFRPRYETQLFSRETTQATPQNPPPARMSRNTTQDPLRDPTHEIMQQLPGDATELPHSRHALCPGPTTASCRHDESHTQLPGDVTEPPHSRHALCSGDRPWPLANMTNPTCKPSSAHSNT